MDIGIIEIGISNSISLVSATKYLGFSSRIVNDPSEIEQCTHLILPGVGSFFEAMKRIDERNLTKSIILHANKSKPLLGICLGMQILATTGNEGGLRKGLDLIPGEVKKLNCVTDRPLNHVGWNSIKLINNCQLFNGIGKEVDYYFVHGFRFHAKKEQNIIATAHYNEEFPAVIQKANIFGFQFHPEKSQKNGLKLLSNFCQLM